MIKLFNETVRYIESMLDSEIDEKKLQPSQVIHTLCSAGCFPF